MCTRLVLYVHKWLARFTTQKNFLSHIDFGIKTVEKLNLIQAAVTVDTFNNGKLDSTEDYYFTFIILLILYSFFPDFSSIRYIHAHTHTVCAHYMPEYLTFTTKMSTMNSFLLLRSFGILKAHSAILSYYRAAAWIYYRIDVSHSKMGSFWVFMLSVKLSILVSWMD